MPLLKIETDFTSQSAGQLLTRIQAFSETVEGSEVWKSRKRNQRGGKRENEDQEFIIQQELTAGRPVQTL